MMLRDPLHHPCVAGRLTEEMVSFVGMDGPDYIASVDFTLGAGSKRPFQVKGQLILTEQRTYDMVVFALLREMFGLEFPRLIIVDYFDHIYRIAGKMIATRRFPDRPLKQIDYFPHTEKNLAFRYQLSLMVFFCKFVGCPFSLRDVRVLDGVPFFWRASSLGSRNAPTITPEEFSMLFGVTPEVARDVFHSSNHESLSDGDILSKKGQLLTDDDLFSVVTPNVNYSEIKGTMFNMVVEFFREVDFDLDAIRSCIYIQENAVRSAVKNKKNFELSRSPREIERVLEENHSILCSAYPFRIFRTN